MMNKGIQNMTRAAHIQPTTAWPTTPGISHAGRTAPLLLEEKGPGDEVDWTCPQRSGYIHHSKILHHSLIDVPCSVFNSSRTFSAKERDLETGYSYFGARYYDAGLSIWLSVDPMAHERSWLSPYNYCQWNPMVLVDPTGMLDEAANPPVRQWDASRGIIMSFRFSRNKDGHELSTGTTTITETRNSGMQMTDQNGILVTSVEHVTTTSVTVAANGEIGRTATRTTVSTVRTIGEDGRLVTWSGTSTSIIPFEAVSSDGLKSSARQVSAFVKKRGVSPVQVAARRNQKLRDSWCTPLGVVSATTGTAALLSPEPISTFIAGGVSAATGATAVLIDAFTQTDPAKLQVNIRDLRNL
jgi:RHS repeat-associated protein